MLSTRESFRSLEPYRNSQNKVESLADFVFEINPELLAYAESLDKEHDVEKVRPALLRMGRLKRMSYHGWHQKLNLENGIVYDSSIVRTELLYD